MTATVLSLRRSRETGPSSVHGNLPPKRIPNLAVRSREYLTPDEVKGLIKAAKNIGRHGHRDAALILLAYRHGFRVSELIALRWDQIDLKQGTLHVNRLKNGSESVHPLRGPELRALRRAQRDYPSSPYVFLERTERPSHSLLCQEDRSASRTKRWHTVSRSPAHAPPCLRLQAGE